MLNFWKAFKGLIRNSLQVLTTLLKPSTAPRAPQEPLQTPETSTLPEPPMPESSPWSATPPTTPLSVVRQLQPISVEEVKFLPEELPPFSIQLQDPLSMSELQAIQPTIALLTPVLPRSETLSAPLVKPAEKPLEPQNVVALPLETTPLELQPQEQPLPELSPETPSADLLDLMQEFESFTKTNSLPESTEILSEPKILESMEVLSQDQLEQQMLMQEQEILMKLSPPEPLLELPKQATPLILISTSSETIEDQNSPMSSQGLTTEFERPTLEQQVANLPEISGTETLPPAISPMIILEPVTDMSPKKKDADTLSEPMETTSAIDIETSLEDAASEWKTDVLASGMPHEPAPTEAGAETETETAPVTFVMDPYAMNTLDVAAAQKDDEFQVDDSDLEMSDEDEIDDGNDPELVLDTDEKAIEETLEGLKAAMDEQDAEQAKLVAEAEALDEEAREKLLAAQIAEDEALEKAMKEEAENGLENDPELLAALPTLPEEDDDGNLDLSELESCIEALLFMVDKPMSAKKLHEHLGPEMPLHLFQEALTRLKGRYQRLHHGIELVEIANGYQFRTKPVRAALAKKLAKVTTQRLSTGAMESLAIVAYKQPCLKDDIDKIRGVDSSHFIRGLLDKKLIKIAGRSELPGRPMLYETTQDFLELFSLKNLEALPSLREIESMVPGSQGGAHDEDPRVKEMRRLVGEMKADTSTSLIYDPKEDEKFLAEIKERVQGIAVSTPTIDEQKAREKAIAEGLIDPAAEAMAEAIENAAPGKTPEMPL